MLTTVRTRVMVKEDGTIEAKAPGGLPLGEHEAVIIVRTELPEPQFRWEDFPMHEGDWDHSVSLRREDLYGDDGR
jgi:hypothetical protein